MFILHLFKMAVKLEQYRAMLQMFQIFVYFLDKLRTRT